VTLAFLCLAASHCLFTPPTGWDVVSPDKLSGLTRVAFVGKKSGSLFQPTLNLSIEKVNVSLDEYIASVKKRQEAHPKRIWRDLGVFTTAAGPGRLTCLDMPSKWGELRLMQVILLKEETAYILTAAALKKDAPALLSVFQNAFHSLSLVPDLMSAIPDEKRRNMLKAWQKNPEKVSCHELQQLLLNEFGDLGAYWQLLAAKELTNEKPDSDRNLPSSCPAGR